MCAGEISSELCLPRVGLKEYFCPVFSSVLGVASSATNGGIYQLFNAGRSFQTRGDNLHRKVPPRLYSTNYSAKERRLRTFSYYAHSTGANSRTILAALMSSG